MERPAYHHGNLSEALLDAAETVLGEGREPSLRELAQAVGVTPNAPYRHFADKAALMAAVSERGFERLGATLEGRGLEDAFVRYFAFATAHPATYRLMFAGLSPDPTAPRTPAARRTFEALTHAVARELPGGSPFVAALRGATVAWSAVHGYATLSLAGAIGSGDGTDAATLAAIVRAGLRATRVTTAPVDFSDKWRREPWRS